MYTPRRWVHALLYSYDSHQRVAAATPNAAATGGAAQLSRPMTVYAKANLAKYLVSLCE
jgi:hypothetical protein